jgi:magnesium-transporting ATPase (P-type)
MSVVVRALWESEFRVFCKGAPEAVVSLCKPDEVPKDFSSVLQNYTRQGLRVLALAGKRLKVSAYHRIHRLAREDVESELTLLGFLVMENRLKRDSAKVIKGLRESDIRCIMVTGAFSFKLRGLFCIEIRRLPKLGFYVNFVYPQKM